MCGIAGIVSDGSVDAERLSRALLAMSESLTHRGPDGHGQWTADGAGVAHRRLSIIDIEGGAQPFLSDSEDLVLTFNGEIYNFMAVRNDLEAMGIMFRTRSDTEVVLRAWECWGKKCLARLEGMFAFAIWDRRERTLFLARDRVGIKPLYYTSTNTAAFLFGSELKSLLASGLMPNRTLRADTVVDYLTLGYAPLDKSFLDGVSKVLPGELVVVSDNGRQITREIYWSPSTHITETNRQTVTADEVWETLSRSVEKQMVADVPVAAFLSGGVDSSGVTAAMAQTSTRPVTAYTIAIGSGEHNEAQFAQEVANHYRMNHEIGVVSDPLLNDFKMIPQLYDEPFADSSAIPTLRLCRHAAIGHKVALSGDGGDECFLGYPWYQSHIRRESIRKRFGHRLTNNVAHLSSSFLRLVSRWSTDARGKGTLASLATDSVDGYLLSQSLDPVVDVRSLLNARLRSDTREYATADLFRSVVRDHDPGDVQTARILDFNFYLPGDILTKVDRASMSASLEVRVPLLDEDVVKLAARATTESVLKDGELKGLLKNAVRPHLPQGLLDRPKQGFSVPLAQWFREQSGDLLESKVQSGVIDEQSILSAAAISALLVDHRAKRADHSALLWAALVLTESIDNIL